MDRVTRKVLFISYNNDLQAQPGIFKGWACVFCLSLSFLAC